MQITGKKTQLKEFISLIILFIILNCSSRQTLLISHGNKPFSQFDWKIEEGLPFQYTPDKEEDGWNSFKRKVNFFRSHLWIWMDEHSTIMSAPTSHCLILTGMISDVRN
jgi:hypothetical protein